MTTAIRSTFIRFCALVVVGTATFGCVAGLDSVLFVTKTETAIDVDTMPPSLDVGYAREEFVLSPAFENGKVLPVLATVGQRLGAFNFGSSHSFATGEAALVFTDYLTDVREYPFGQIGRVAGPSLTGTGGTMDGSVTTTLPAPPKGFWDSLVYLFAEEPGQRPYFFGTDTTFGLHVEWSDTTVPSSVSLGFKRKELAFVPLIEEVVQGGAGQPGKPRKVKVASLLAVANAKSTIGSLDGTAVGIGQAFATGDAATLLAKHGAVRLVLGPAIVPNFQEMEAMAHALGIAGRNSISNLVVLTSVYEGLSAAADERSDAVAKAHRDRLNALARSRRAMNFPRFKLTPDSKKLIKETYTDGIVGVGGNDFSTLIAYVSNLQLSEAALASVLATSSGEVELEDKTTTSAATRKITLSAVPDPELATAATDLRRLLDEAQGTYGSHPDLLAAVSYFTDTLLRISSGS